MPPVDQRPLVVVTVFDGRHDGELVATPADKLHEESVIAISTGLAFCSATRIPAAGARRRCSRGRTSSMNPIRRTPDRVRRILLTAATSSTPETGSNRIFDTQNNDDCHAPGSGLRYQAESSG